MQYLVYNEDSREIIAWIDTNKTEQIAQEGFDIVIGENLNVSIENVPNVDEVNDELNVRIKFFDEYLYAGENSLQKIGEKSDWIDLRARESIRLKAGDSYYIPLGVAMQLPKGYEAHVIPRSSTFKNWGIIQTNSMGLIDESYCGDNDEWKLPVYAIKDTVINRGDRVCQFRLMKHQPKLNFEVVNVLGNADRNGFGSTGTK